MTPTTAARDLRTFERLGQGRQVWSELGEADIGRQWPLAKMACYQRCAQQRSSVRRAREALEQRLVQWVVAGITVHGLRSTFARDISHEAKQ